VNRILKKLLVLALASLGLVFLTSCAAFMTRIPNKAPGPFAGVRQDAQLVSRPPHYHGPRIPPAVVVCFCVLDMPFSAAADILFLPMDLTYRKENQPQPLVLQVLEISISKASTNRISDAIATVPVRVRLRNPRAVTVPLRIASVARLVGCSNYTDSVGRRWEFCWGGFGARYDDSETLFVAAHSEAEYEVPIYTSKLLLHAAGEKTPISERDQMPATFQFRIGDSDIETATGSNVPIIGSGTVYLK
jgi:uncharacterized protein YceK